MRDTNLRRNHVQWRRLFGPLKKLPLSVGYAVAVFCSGAIGYSLAVAGSNSLDSRQSLITLIAVIAGALILGFLLHLVLRRDERRQVERAEQLRLRQEAAAAQLLDRVDRDTLGSLDEIASVKGVDRATLIPAVLHQYVARKSFEAALREHALRSKAQPPPQPEAPPGWENTLPAWLETLPGSLDVKSV